MAKVGTFGTIRFTVSDQRLLTFSGLKREVKGKWNNIERIGSKPLTVFSGADLQTITLTIIIDAGLGVAPRKILGQIEKMVENGSAEYLIIGKKQVGSKRWVIIKSSEAWEQVMVKGELFRASVDLTLQEYV